MNEPALAIDTTAGAVDDVGSYFVSNYPPYASWRREAVDDALAVLDRAPTRDVPLGVYAHIPFCRKRCRFCYFKVYTETPGAEVRRYLTALTDEAARWSRRAAITGRTPRFLYVGGGTPSYLSSSQIRQLFEGLHAALPWADDAEVTYECEPGTVRRPKLEALRDHGVTRVSLGVESFVPELLELNGRAHGEGDIRPAYDLARSLDFPQVNLDLIAGLLGETDATWRHSVEEALALQPDSITIYQMEVPYNTRIARGLRDGTDLGGALAPFATRRRWASEAFERLEAEGYIRSSGYTAVRADGDKEASRFVYRDGLWHGADMVGLGVSAFGHVQGAHLQNRKHLPAYLEALESGEPATARALVMTPTERMVRELVLQLKLGRVGLQHFAAHHGVDLTQRFAAVWDELEADGHLAVHPRDGELVLTPQALMQVDRLLPAFFLPEHGGPTRDPRGRP